MKKLKRWTEAVREFLADASEDVEQLEEAESRSWRATWCEIYASTVLVDLPVDMVTQLHGPARGGCSTIQGREVEDVYHRMSLGSVCLLTADPELPIFRAALRRLPCIQDLDLLSLGRFSVLADADHAWSVTFNDNLNWPYDSVLTVLAVATGQPRPWKS